jgi:hypothetical protein
MPKPILRGWAAWAAGAADHELDLVHVEQLGVDRRHGRRIALVVVGHELDLAAEQAALGVHVIDPDLHGDQGRLAVGGQRTGLRHAQSDTDRIGGARGRTHRQEDDGNGNDRRAEPREQFPGIQRRHYLPPLWRPRLEAFFAMLRRVPPGALARCPIGWNHPIRRPTRQIISLEHDLIRKVGQLFGIML